MANSAKTNIEVLFKKIHAVTLGIYFKNILSKESVNLCFSVIIISYLFPENFIEMYQVSQKTLIFASVILILFCQFYLLQKKIISAVSWLGIILDGLLKNCIKLYYYWTSSSSIMKVGGVILTHPE